jgi:hypothetical protein
MEDPFRDGDAVTLLGVLAGGVIAIVVLICVGAWIVASYLSRPAPPENHTPVVTVCSGCGSEWHSRGPGPHDSIEKCPNCPMSDEEFEALKRKYRKPANHLPPSASVLVEEPSR